MKTIGAVRNQPLHTGDGHRIGDAHGLDSLHHRRRPPEAVRLDHVAHGAAVDQLSGVSRDDMRARRAPKEAAPSPPPGSRFPSPQPGRRTCAPVAGHGWCASRAPCRSGAAGLTAGPGSGRAK